MCSWCGKALEKADHWRADEAGGEREASFCRLEHVVPWAMRRRDWAAATLVHHRAGRRIEESFDSVEEMRAWAAAGGPWQGGR